MKQRTNWRKISISLLLAMLLLTGCKNAGETAEERKGTPISLSGMDADSYRVKEVLSLEEGGYAVTVEGSGFESVIEAKVYFDQTADRITGLEILSQQETEGLGSRITEPEFLAVFSDLSSPVTVTESDMQIVDPVMAAEIEKTKQEALVEGKDGIYEAQASEFSSGYKMVTALTIEDGKITDISVDAVNEDGVLKSDISKNGQYVMTEDGLLWHEQAEKLEEYMVENQIVSVPVDDAGKTDAVAGVSISVSEACKLLQDCYAQAKGGSDNSTDIELPVIEGTAFDAVTGATKTSEGVARAINNAYFFLKNCIVK